MKDHWEKLILRCWVTKGTERILYQEAALSEILDPQGLMGKMPREGMDNKESFILFSGTIPTKGGLIFGNPYELEMEDPLLKRAIKHSYRRVRILPQHI